MRQIGADDRAPERSGSAESDPERNGQFYALLRAQSAEIGTAITRSANANDIGPV